MHGNLALAFALLACCACVSRTTAARSTFSAEAACPKPRVIAWPMRFVASPAATEKEAARVKELSDHAYFRAEGCGRSVIYACDYCSEGSERLSCRVRPTCAEPQGCRSPETAPSLVSCPP